MTLFKDKYRIESARLKGYDYSSPGLYFVTICTRNRVPYFGEVLKDDVRLSRIGEIVSEEWMKTAEVRPYVQLDEWIAMPNHIHGIIVITDLVETFRGNVSQRTRQPNVSGGTFQRNVSTKHPSRLKPHSLGSIIGQFKSVCTKRIWAEGFGDFDWQERFWDEIVRTEKTLQTIRQYIIDNPIKWEVDREKPMGLWM